MNIYSVKFKVICPSDGELIDYKLTIFSKKIIMVEVINEFVTNIIKGYHEIIADSLYKEFGEFQILTAVHQKVNILTIRGNL